MRDSLQIGEVARLLGITPKTIRHYHKRGLIAEPPRSEGGYRLYGASHLLRLRQIRLLKQYGLSLASIGELLHASEQDLSLWGHLHTRRDELTTQIADLQHQLAQIEQMLADEPPDLMAQLDRGSPALAALYDQLTPLLPAGVDGEQLEALRALDEKLFARIEAFAWPGGTVPHTEIAAFFTENPDAYQRLVVLALRLLELPAEPESESEARALAAQLRALTPQMPQGHPGLPAPFAVVFRELLLEALTPAQRRLLEPFVDE